MTTPDALRLKTIPRGTQNSYTYKYNDDLAAHAPCPPSGAVPRSFVGFRFAHKDYPESDFLPVGKMLGENRRCCLAFAVSIYDSIECARRAHASASKSAPQFKKRVGDFYCKIEIKPEHGVATPANERGHVSFFEYSGVNWRSLVADHGPLYET